VLGRLVLLLLVAGVLLCCCSYRRVSRWMEQLGKPAAAFGVPKGWDPVAYAQRCAELTTVAARHSLYRPQCLPQALALQCLLAQGGLAARLCIGVLPSLPVQAHAWVEYAGHVLGSQDVSGYRPFDPQVEGDLPPLTRGADAP